MRATITGEHLSNSLPRFFSRLGSERALRVVSLVVRFFFVNYIPFSRRRKLHVLILISSRLSQNAEKSKRRPPKQTKDENTQ